MLWYVIQKHKTQKMKWSALRSISSFGFCHNKKGREASLFVMQHGVFDAIAMHVAKLNLNQHI